MDRFGKLITLIIALTLFFPALSYGQSYFLNVPNIPGEVSEPPQFKDQICITSFSWEVMRDVSIGGPSSAAMTGEFKFSKTFDRASPLLFGAVVQGQTIPRVIFTIYTENDESGYDLAVYSLQNVNFTSYQPGGEIGSLPKEVFSLLAEEVKISHFALNPDGTVGAETTFEWDFESNTGG